jgi:hypothetical protein
MRPACAEADVSNNTPDVIVVDHVSKTFALRKDNSLKERIVTLGRRGTLAEDQKNETHNKCDQHAQKQMFREVCCGRAAPELTVAQARSNNTPDVIVVDHVSKTFALRKDNSLKERRAKVFDT